ncbi:MAG: hypothetical protein ISS25_03105 [Nanoarchaeota archaeon]|nr:hypothetical protein [DPANN group archaeon]MBL7116789.1 hypothetical protein [Nanoarchaeota archaeon]
MQQRIRTGEILERDYGITLHLSGVKKIFISPVKYAIAELMLETPSRIRERIKEKARREGVSIKELSDKLVQGVLKREKSKDFLNRNTRGSLRKVELHSGVTYSAQVRSKEKSGPDFFNVLIRNPFISDDRFFEYEFMRCSCDDNFWNDIRNFYAMCIHLSELEVALYRDELEGLSAKKNLTRLFPRERKPNPWDTSSMPFTFFDKGTGRAERDRLLTDVLFERYVDGKSYSKINRELFQNRDIYSEALIYAIEEGAGRFEVLRGKERTREKRLLAPNDKRRYGAIKALEKRIIRMFDYFNMWKKSYVLEFQGTPWEVTAQRFEKKDSVYSLCIGKNMLPLIVKKTLRNGIVSDWTISEDRNLNSPFKRKSTYESIDDTIRRIGLTQIIIPGIGAGAKIDVPGMLRQEYRRLI